MQLTPQWVQQMQQGSAITEGVSNATNATMGAANATGNASQGNPILDALKNLFGGMSGNK